MTWRDEDPAARPQHGAFVSDAPRLRGLLLPDAVHEQRLITWLPADDATAIAFARSGNAAVPTSPAQLRVIG